MTTYTLDDQIRDTMQDLTDAQRDREDAIRQQWEAVRQADRARFRVCEVRSKLARLQQERRAEAAANVARRLGEVIMGAALDATDVAGADTAPRHTFEEVPA